MNLLWAVTILIIVAILWSNHYAKKSFGPPYYFLISSSLFMLVFGALLFTQNKPKNDRMHFVNHYKSGSVFRLNIEEELRHSEYYFKYKAKVVQVGQEKTRGDLILRIVKGQDYQPILLDYDILASEEITTLTKPLNPGAFNFKKAMRKRNLYHQVTLQQEHFIKTKIKRKNLKKKAILFRRSLLESLSKLGFSQEEFSVIEALLLGRRQDLSKSLITNYQRAGATHLLAISGLHIGIILMILHFVLWPLNKLKGAKKIKPIIVISILWIFAFISGLSVSVIRAVFMFTLLSIGLYFDRKSPLNRYLFISFFLSLLIKPELAFDLGFQLSYMAVLSIIGIAPKVLNIWQPQNKFISYLWNLLVISFAAQLGVLPLSLYYFHQFSALFIFSSLCLIPFLGIILGAGYLMIILNYFKILPELYIEIYQRIIKLMNRFIEFLGNIDRLVFDDIFFSLVLLISSYLLIVSIISYYKTYSAKWIINTLVCLFFIFVELLVQKTIINNTQSFIIFHDYNKSLMINRFGSKGKIYAPFAKERIVNQRLIKDYVLDNYDLKLKESSRMKHFFEVADKRILIIDDQSITSDFGFNPDILVLINSPKINLDRLLETCNPETIIADGSNFLSFKMLWKVTVEKRGLQFYDTSEKGAFTVESSI